MRLFTTFVFVCLSYLSYAQSLEEATQMLQKSLLKCGYIDKRSWVNCPYDVITTHKNALGESEYSNLRYFNYQGKPMEGNQRFQIEYASTDGALKQYYTFKLSTLKSDIAVPKKFTKVYNGQTYTFYELVFWVKDGTNKADWVQRGYQIDGEDKGSFPYLFAGIISADKEAIDNVRTALIAAIEASQGQK